MSQNQRFFIGQSTTRRARGLKIPISFHDISRKYSDAEKVARAREKRKTMIYRNRFAFETREREMGRWHTCYCIHSFCILAWIAPVGVPMFPGTAIFLISNLGVIELRDRRSDYCQTFFFVQTKEKS